MYNDRHVDDSLDNPISGTRDEISGLTCNEHDEKVNLIEYDGSLNKAYDILNSSSDLEKKIVFISFCENEEDDNTCGIQSICDPNDDVEIMVVNVGSEAPNFHLKGCSTGENLF